MCSLMQIRIVSSVSFNRSCFASTRCQTSYQALPLRNGGYRPIIAGRKNMSITTKAFLLRKGYPAKTQKFETFFKENDGATCYHKQTRQAPAALLQSGPKMAVWWAAYGQLIRAAPIIPKSFSGSAQQIGCVLPIANGIASQSHFNANPSRMGWICLYPTILFWDCTMIALNAMIS